ncbi:MULTISPECIES: bifunctional 5,10-methylenetetrahydrofolate dehydrogenase/5,10-methenyltetrahydrofolate cyclohydrolase [Kocuria]|jgi:methylenetetrahydrofolate dehydrogenase (NADP+)/methenyltetrahydrofolate cyclohydrolase|uniref:bifunctional 5,10-methylenetetrahydrofolate dehydrogenase/5,10-methenyltetrahydrofolate cyclohydrolase n=1 Tax=Kocuria TaxID=57493 RepID=UPI00203D1645|nr:MULTISPECIES: bifunctional 5,10-methylenetetrahydrofolate dehydrogenase/5,10-methenyltetrahydrofolate cyclohydrolase [Kocuria]MCM3689092.1 bifunctional 5,10-methylenetetrahydrofolate dehydrogenase/5,10-methenyltetrahydrofolate cyclohydrolase [Kocuria rosea]HST73471.1 bifunctional 5,10-methylenetetrahydrofolate dehydrogenase/5,10-methenyltetrahydrofolate cyclohydrolase [Kocuria rosea]
MSALPLAGAPVAQKLRAETAENVSRLRGSGVVPRLAVVVATDNEATLWYVRSIARAAEKAGVECAVVDLGADARAERIASELTRLSADDATHGIILQTPLPPGVDADELIGAIDAGKDIDGANPLSLGRLTVGQDAFAPATARAVVEILEHYDVPVAGRHVTVVGRSAVVGKPLLQLLLQRDATVTVCHSRSRPLDRYTREADVVVAAVGRPDLLTGDQVRAEAVVVDVGTNVLEDGRLVGDVEPTSTAAVASALTPVPGGVGTVTTALLVLHTTQAALQLSEAPAAAAARCGG